MENKQYNTLGEIRLLLDRDDANDLFMLEKFIGSQIKDHGFNFLKNKLIGKTRAEQLDTSKSLRSLMFGGDIF